MLKPNYESLRSGGREPILHPNGFIQLSLNDESTSKLHVWPDFDVPRRPGDHTIHDHVFDISSTVLCGQLIHVEYDVEFHDNYAIEMYGLDPDYRVWQATDKCRNARKIAQKGGSILEAQDEYAIVTDVRTIRQPAGKTYFFPAFSFHDNTAEELTATLMTKPKVYPGEPRVLCKMGQHPDDLFLRKEADSAMMWETIRRALERVDD
jgi:hypothetical protein